MDAGLNIRDISTISEHSMTRVPQRKDSKKVTKKPKLKEKKS